MEPDEPRRGRRVDPGPDAGGKIDATGDVLAGDVLCGVVPRVVFGMLSPTRRGETVVVEVESLAESTTAIDSWTGDERCGCVARLGEIFRDRAMGGRQKALPILSDAMNRFRQARQDGRRAGGLTSARRGRPGEEGSLLAQRTDRASRVARPSETGEPVGRQSVHGDQDQIRSDGLFVLAPDESCGHGEYRQDEGNDLPTELSTLDYSRPGGQSGTHSRGHGAGHSEKDLGCSPHALWLSQRCGRRRQF